MTLYDQYNNPATTSSVSQDFEPANAAFSSQVADDFPVPSGQTWSVNEVDAQAVYFNGAGPAASFNVFFYTNSGVLPATPVYTATGLAYTNTSGNFVIPLTTPAVLAGGSGTNYWVSVQARMDYTPDGEFGWTDRTVLSNSPAAFRNPGGGFACPGGNDWQPKLTCVPTAGGPDQVFRLLGSIGGGATATPTAVGATATATTCATGYNYLLGSGALIPATTRIDGAGCDDCTTAISSLPFPFTLYGTSYTAATVGSNGTLAFGTNNNAFAGSCLPVTGATNQMMPFFRDQRTDCANGCGIYTATTGTAPNRIFSIEYRTIYFGETSTTPTLDYEVNLYESGGVSFDYTYGLINATTQTGRITSVGVQQTTTSYTQYACDSTGQAPPVSTGQRITWSVTACATPTVPPTATVPLPTITVPVASPTTPANTPTVAPTQTTGGPSATTVSSSTPTTPAPTITPGGPSSTPTVPVPTPTACTITFTDVPPSQTFYQWIRCLACRNIINGYPDGTFRPNSNVTRGQLSKIASNSAGFTDTPTGQQFQDVPPSGPGSTFYPYIYRLVIRGYINGYPCGGPGEPCIPPANLPYFRPNTPVTRGQITKIISNAAGFSDAPSGQQFQDVAPGSTFYTYTYRLVTRGVMSGYPCGSPPAGQCVPPSNLPYFRPNNNATRGQTSKIDANTFFPDCVTPQAAVDFLTDVNK